MGNLDSQAKQKARSQAVVSLSIPIPILILISNDSVGAKRQVNQEIDKTQ